MRVKAADGLKVLDPKTGKAIEPGFEIKEMSTYWERRIKSGDVIVMQEQKVESVLKSKKALSKE